jgi:ABC-type transporter Mla maintaining outer membrane lipid asymmetry ATPase subunit MlaF
MSENVFHTAVIEMRGVDVGALRDTSLTVVENVNWSVLPGEFWVVAGPQRSGKSDLLMHAAGLMTPVHGGCRVFGCDTNALGEAQLAERLRVGFVFAGGKLFNELTLAENVALPLRYQKNLSAAEVAPAVAAFLDWFELTPFAGALPANVAANWRQRAALARALILQPELLLLDNPLAGLDGRHRRWLMQFLDQLQRGHDRFGGRPMTIVATTEDLRAWRNAERRFAVLHEKKLSVLGSWPDVESAGHPAVKELLAEPAVQPPE